MPDTNVSDCTVIASTTDMSRATPPEQAKTPEPAAPGHPRFERLSGLMAS